MCLSLHHFQIHMLKSNTQDLRAITVFGYGPLKLVIKTNEVIWMSPWCNISRGPYKKRRLTQRVIEGRPCKGPGEVTIKKPMGEDSEEIYLWQLISDFYFSKLRNKFLLFKWPIVVLGYGSPSKLKNKSNFF